MADLDTLLRLVACGPEPQALASLEALAAGPLAEGMVLTDATVRAIPALVGAMRPGRPILQAEAAWWLLGFGACLPGADRWAEVRAVAGRWVALPEAEVRRDAPVEAGVRWALAAAAPSLRDAPSPPEAAVVREAALALPAARACLHAALESATDPLSRAILRDGMVALGEPAPSLAPDASAWERALAGGPEASEAFLLEGPAEDRVAAQPWARLGLFTNLGLPLLQARPRLRGRLVDQQRAHGWLELSGVTLLATAFHGRAGPDDRDAVVQRALDAVAAPVRERGSVEARRALARFGCMDVVGAPTSAGDTPERR